MEITPIVYGDPGSLRVKRLHPKAQLPVRATKGAAGLDLFAVEDSWIKPGAHALIPTGIAIEMPFGFYGRIAPRSGLAVKYGINVHAGVIDPDYREEIRVALINHGAKPMEIRTGERIAQIVLEWYSRCKAEWAEELSPSDRGGFGSTGR